MDYKVLKLMSLEDIAEFDRLIGNIAQAMDELELVKKGDLVARGMTVEDFERILDAQRASFTRFKVYVLEKYMFHRFYLGNDNDTK